MEFNGNRYIGDIVLKRRPEGGSYLNDIPAVKYLMEAGHIELRSPVTFFIGENGTGKSTFLKVLAGLVKPDSGRISRRPNLQVSYLPQNPEMDDDRTILEQVFASMPPQFRALNEYEAKAMLTKLGLGETDRRIGTLSGGERRRAALCAALIHPADVLVLLVDHKAFKATSGDAVRQKYVVDTKGVWR